MRENERQLREDLLAKLHDISFGAILTNLISEACLEVIIFTSKGTCYRWIGYDDWNVYHIADSASSKLSSLKEQLAKGCLLPRALEGTCFALLAEHSDHSEPEQLFSDFVGKDILCGKEFFCYYNEYESKYFFFSNQEELATALSEYYSNDVTDWETMDTNDLLQCWQSYEEEGNIPLRCIEEDA